MHSPASSLRYLRLTPLATFFLIASPSYALELQPQVITGNPLGSSQLAIAATARLAIFICQTRPINAATAIDA